MTATIAPWLSSEQVKPPFPPGLRIEVQGLEGLVPPSLDACVRTRWGSMYGE